MKRAPTLHLSFLTACLVGTLSVACGGSFVSSDEGEDGTGGGSSDDTGGTGGEPSDGTIPGTGGAPGTGGDGTGGDASSGGQGTGGEPPVCCTADATCDSPGDLQLESDVCPIGGECYSATVCCSTIWCMKEQPACDGIPVCAEGETEVQECPEGWSCVQRAHCGTVITCRVDDSLCDLGPEPHRHYVGSSATECAGIDFSCPEFTTGFSEACGCGCEQPDTCPEVIDCAPGGPVVPLCNSDECPYSTRAL